MHIPARTFLTSFLLLALSVTPPEAQQPTTGASASGEVLTNDLVLKMVAAKFGDQIILSKIHTSTCKFDTSIEAILKLKEAGVSDTVIQAMVEASARTNAEANDAASKNVPSADPNDPATPHEPGIYWLPKEKREKQMVQLEPSVYSQGKTGGMFASAVTYGIAKAKWKAVVRGGRSNLRISEEKPEFWFYFEVTTHGLSQSGYFFSGASSPNEFILARMSKKSKERELVVGEFGALGSSTGTRSKDVVDFEFKKIAPGIYRVTPNQPLQPGEYCFFYAGANMAMGMTGGKLFDFGVDAAK